MNKLNLIVGLVIDIKYLKLKMYKKNRTSFSIYFDFSLDIKDINC